jgi:ATP-binding cassette subfamily B protein
MADETPPSPSVTSLLRRLGPYVRQDWPLYTLALLAAPITTVLMVVQPWLLKTAIDDHILANDVAGVLEIAWWYLGAVLVGFGAEALYMLALSYAAMKTIASVRRDVYAHTLRLQRAYFDKHPTGRLLTRVTSDVEALGETLTAGAVTILLDVLLVIGILVAMFSIEAKLTGLLLLLGPPLAIVLDVVRRRLRRLYITVRSTLSALNAYMAERITGLAVVQLYRDEERTLTTFDEKLKAYRDTTIQSNIWDALMFAIVDGLSSVCMAILLWYGAGAFGETAVSAGVLAAFIEYISRLFGPIREFSQKLAVIQRAAAALEKIFGLLDTDARIRFGDVDLPGELQRVAVEDLRFAYTPGEPILKGLSFEVEAGRVLAIVGRTGSGKSTIGRILTRAYAGYEGSIRVDGVEITDLTEASLRGSIGVVQQDVQLFGGTVRFNLTLGADIPDERLLEAVRLCRATALVERLGGLDGRITAKGGNVSVGEGQLLSFARTLATETPMVILDEATANVDSLTEAAIQAATDVLLERRTVIVIAHRLSTVMKADEILVMDAGRVLERGDHATLMARQGVYHGLFESQLAGTTGPLEE